MSDTITILGTRGSLPMCGGRFIEYGGLTTCVLVHMGGQYLVLDAGTGIMDLPEEAMRQTELPLVLTHTHVDHLMGMPMCPYVMRKGSRLDIYGRTRAGYNCSGGVCRWIPAQKGFTLSYNYNF